MAFLFTCSLRLYPTQAPAPRSLGKMTQYTHAEDYRPCPPCLYRWDIPPPQPTLMVKSHIEHTGPSPCSPYCITPSLCYELMFSGSQMIIASVCQLTRCVLPGPSKQMSPPSYPALLAKQLLHVGRVEGELQIRH